MAQTRTIETSPNLEITKEELEQKLLSYMVHKHDEKISSVSFRQEIIDRWKEVLHYEVEELFDLMNDWEVQEQIDDMTQDYEEEYE